MPATYRSRLVTAISNTPGTSGAFTIATAASGYRTFGAADDGLSFDVAIVDGTAWEVRTGCVYTHAGTSLARGTLEASSTGSSISLTSATVLTSDASAAFFGASEQSFQGVLPGGRLTLESGVPVSTTNQTAKTTVYYTPYVSNTVALWDGLRWAPTPFAETALALGTLVNARPYDVFAYLSSGVLALELLAWTNDTTRATAVTLQDGRYCKSGDKTRLWLGTFVATSTTTTEDSESNCWIWNMYNQVTRQIRKLDTSSHTINGVTTAREWNNGTAVRVNFVSGLPARVAVTCTVRVVPGASNAFIYPALNGNRAPDGGDFVTSKNPYEVTLRAMGVFTASAGKNYGTLLEAEFLAATATLDFGHCYMELTQ